MLCGSVVIDETKDSDRSAQKIGRPALVTFGPPPTIRTGWDLMRNSLEHVRVSPAAVTSVCPRPRRRPHLSPRGSATVAA
ncbi:hypothetical protein SSPO_013630 [Streptomyces antimycoticus]|uniref:Uncharacterized protein n=2 Tax=Streptomyces TaxID=1883 RepID=A0A499UBX3_9ACTN|nr:hypothetical protein SSPO_013630 [Streptomyces antimycoticus]